MSGPNFILLYVSEVHASARFYAAILGAEPLEESPGFAMFALPSGVMLGLWARNGVLPPATARPGASEIAWALQGEDEVNNMRRQWGEKNIPFIQEPTHMDFGYTATAQDPDGHRLRLFAPVSE